MLVPDPLASALVLPPTLPVALLSRAGRLALRAAADPAQAALDPALAGLLQRTAQHSDGLRALLDQLDKDLSAGNVAAASVHLHSILEPVRLLDATQARFDDARQEAHAAVSAAQLAWLPDAHPASRLPDLAVLRQVHAAASAAAAALDDLALCAQALAAALDTGGGGV